MAPRKERIPRVEAPRGAGGWVEAARVGDESLSREAGN